MLLPIELFHVCVRIHIDISDIRRDPPGPRPERTSRDVPDASRSASGTIVPARQPRASAARRRGDWRLGSGSGHWVCATARLAAGRGLCVHVARGRRV